MASRLEGMPGRDSRGYDPPDADERLARLEASGRNLGGDLLRLRRRKLHHFCRSLEVVPARRHPHRADTNGV